MVAFAPLTGVNTVMSSIDGDGAAVVGCRLVVGQALNELFVLPAVAPSVPRYGFGGGLTSDTRRTA